ARNVLGTPVPKVLAWSSKVHGNPVESEYIIMEKVPGVELESKTWASISFKSFGALYYAEDLDDSIANGPLYTDANGVDIVDDRFTIGPSTGSELIDNGRANITFDRGSCELPIKPYNFT
ncbi:hypothetical protein BCR34DRAFT_587823, partial [Clohesyomyces aquaticus]